MQVLKTPIVLELHSAGRQYIGRCWKEATGFSSAKVSADRLCAGYCARTEIPGSRSQFSRASHTGRWVTQAVIELEGRHTAHGSSGKKDRLLQGEPISGKRVTCMVIFGLDLQ